MDRRTTTGLVVAMALASFAQADAFGQCQRGGGGRGLQQSAVPFQTGGRPQSGVNPILAMQQGAMQQAFLQQQFAAQQMRVQQIAMREQARQAQLARRRTTAQQRRDAELVRREEVRAANVARLQAPESQETLVAVRSE